MFILRSGISIVCALCALCVAVFLARAGANQPPEETPVLHPLFTLDDAACEEAVKLGERSAKRGETLDELLKRWSKPAPNAKGYVIPMVPPTLIAGAAFDAERYHKDASTQQRQVEAARKQGREHLSFRVVLRSKGSGTWLWPSGMKPGDREALEAIKFVLADDTGRFFQPLDPEAQKRISSQSVAMGLPYSIGAYVPVGRWYFGIPIPLGGTRQDFEARYEPIFALKDAKGNPTLSQKNKAFSLRIIGHRGEKSIEFTFAELTTKVKQTKVSRLVN